MRTVRRLQRSGQDHACLSERTANRHKFTDPYTRPVYQRHPWNLFSDYWTWFKPKGDELWHTDGCVNEIWQSGFDDVERRPYITQRRPENWVEIHLKDAKARGIESGDQVMLYSNRVPAFKDTIKGVYGDDFQFSELREKVTSNCPRPR